ncbi:uncharacterized protein LOC114402859 isoform X2 [Glycine soja]|uniref:Uncharacterized protein n=1 Tax=Glycine soja TaxID=3848 RepID=A0A445F5K0_GLYSO|nr:uncharacterized protein LOC114402859 isoform X2 [Glycine soja]RZB44121.1 hypothetical protein D0Y65_054245 [Glycine soja]
MTGFTKCEGELHVLYELNEHGLWLRFFPSFNDSGTMKPTSSPSMDQSSTLDALVNDNKIPTPIHAGASTSISVHLSDNGASPEKHLTENTPSKPQTEKAQNGKRKYNKKEYNLPRRGSKRLAGIKVDNLRQADSGELLLINHVRVK